MTTTVRVFHNNDRHAGTMFGFRLAPYRVRDTERPAHTVTEVLSYTALPDDPHPLEYAHNLSLVDDPDFFATPDPRLAEYRERANRALVRGDVIALHDDELGTCWYAADIGGWAALGQAPVIKNAEQRGTTPVDAPLVKYEFTFVKPSQGWIVEAYTPHHLAHYVEQRLGLKQVDVDLTGDHVRFIDAPTGLRIAGLTATPVADAAETEPARSGYTDKEVQAIEAQFADLLADIAENPRFVRCPRCPEDGHDTHCPLCFGSAVLGP